MEEREASTGPERFILPETRPGPRGGGDGECRAIRDRRPDGQAPGLDAERERDSGYGPGLYLCDSHTFMIHKIEVYATRAHRSGGGRVRARRDGGESGES